MLRCFQDRSRRLIDLKEMVKVAVFIAAVLVENLGQIDLLLKRQLANEIRRCSPFEMEVKLDLWGGFIAHITDFPVPWAGTPRWAAIVAATSENPICPSARGPSPWIKTGTRSRV